MVAGKYTGGSQSISADGVSVSVGNLREEYLALAATLRARRGENQGVAPIPDVGGLDRPLYFGIGQWDNIEAGRQDYGDIAHRHPVFYDELREWA